LPVTIGNHAGTIDDYFGEEVLLPLENYLQELSDSSKPLSVSKLSNLSGLSSEESAIFKKAWGDIEVDRRRQIASHLVELTQSNYHLEFDEAFRIILKDSDQETRLFAIEGLRDCEDRSFISPFLELIDKEYDDQTRAAAASALGKFAILAELGKLQSCQSSQIENTLMGIIRNEGEQTDVRRRAIEGIAPLSTPQVKEIIRRAYDSTNPALKRSALCAMGRNCDPVWLPFLLKELRNHDPETRYEAAVACGELCAPETVPQLLKLTRDTDVHVQIAATSSLGHIGSIEAKGELQRQLNNPDERIRHAAEVALEELGFSEDPLSFDEMDD
jgi:HEAT repeat protein